MQTALRNIQEGEFSAPVLIGGKYHAFFVKKKSLVESDGFLRAKRQLADFLFAEKSATVQSPLV